VEGRWEGGPGEDRVLYALSFGLHDVVVTAPTDTKVKLTESGSTMAMGTVEVLAISGGENDVFDVTMSPTTQISIRNWDSGVFGDALITVRVPGGGWTREGGVVTKVGYRSVSWSGGGTVKIRAI
jgi:hypothetical protein